jgi:hypothetical protein
MDYDQEQLVKFRDWVHANLDKPGVLSLSYLPNDIIPAEYFLSPCPDGEKKSVGVRVWLKDWDGKVFDVEYSTSYPQFADGGDINDLYALPEDVQSEAWRIGWESLLRSSALMIASLQSKLMYATAEELSFDIEGFIEKAEKFLPTEIAIQYAVTYLSFLRTRSLLSRCPQDERHEGLSFMLGMVEEILNGVRGLAEGEVSS